MPCVNNIPSTNNPGKGGKTEGCVAKFFEIRDNARFLAIEKSND
jgi:hypothetical protein